MTMLQPAEVFPAGEYLRDELEARGWTVTEFAQILGRPIQAVSEILNNKKEITPESAVDIANALGTSPEMWLELQSAYRLHQLRQAEPEAALSPVARRGRLRKYGPTTEMRRLGWLPDTDDLDALEASVSAMYGVASLDDAPPEFAFAARRSNAGEVPTPEQTAWLARVRTVARSRDVAPFDVAGLEKCASNLARRLRGGPTDLTGLRRELASVGVALVIEPCLRGGKLAGAALFDAERGTAIVGVTTRYDRFDSFVFTLLHELAHLVLGHVTAESGGLVDDTIGEDASDPPAVEAQADHHAGEWIFPGGLKVPPGSVTALTAAQIAEGFGVHASLVIGRLHHLGVLPHSKLRNHLPKITPYLESIEQ